MRPFAPTLQDIESALTILASFRLPDELSLCILDQAQYWMEVEMCSEEHIILVDEAWSLDYSAAYPYLYVPAYPWPHDRHLKAREITFTIVSHDQGWTTEGTEGTYQTSSWFEVSVMRPKGAFSARRHHLQVQPGLRRLRDMSDAGKTVDDIYTAFDIIHPRGMMELVRRPSSVMEPQRTHCTEMINGASQDIKEGDHAWFLQGNEVAREKSIFEGEMIKRYTVTWVADKSDRMQTLNEGTGSGDDFINSLEQNDFICIWARAKRRGWENHIHGVRMVIRYMI